MLTAQSNIAQRSTKDASNTPVRSVNILAMKKERKVVPTRSLDIKHNNQCSNLIALQDFLLCIKPGGSGAVCE